MDRFVTGVKRKSDGKSVTAVTGDATTTTTAQKKVKARKYDDEAYLSLGFTSTMVGQEERPQCVVCLKILAADNMKPNTMRRRLETHHPDHVNKHLEFLKKKLENSSPAEFIYYNAINSKQRRYNPFGVGWGGLQCSYIIKGGLDKVWEPLA